MAIEESFRGTLMLEQQIPHLRLEQLSRLSCGSFGLLSDLLFLAAERGHALGTEDFDAALFD